MSLLKSLEAEAERRRQQQAVEAQQRRDRQQHFAQTLVPALRALHGHLQQLCQGLASSGAVQLLEHEVAGYGRLTARLDHRYSLQLDERVRAAELSLQGEAEILSAHSTEVSVEGVNRVRNLMDLFEQAGVTAFHNGRRDVRGQWVQASFKPRGKLPLKLSVLVEPAATELRLTLAGFEGLTVIQKNIAIEQFDEQLFERIGRYVARLDNDLTREQLPDQFRNSLQQKVQQDALRRSWEDQLYQQRLREEAALKQAIEDQKLLNRGRRLLLDWRGKLLTDPRIAGLLKRLRRKD
jgi:hypothetical protein